MQKIIFMFLLFPFIIHAKNCDTLFISSQAEIHYSTSLDSFGFDSSKVAYRFHSPEGYLFQAPNGDYHLAFRKGKKWRSWATSIEDLEFGNIYCNWKDVDGKGKSELIIWEFNVFGHHAATHAEERTSYTVHIWNIETATLLFSYKYKSSEWYDDMDSHPEDTVGGTHLAPPYRTNEYSELAIYTKAINLHLVSNVHDTTDVYVTEDENGNRIPIDPKEICAPAEGTYIYQHGYWIYSNLPVKTHSPVLHPPDYHPYWEFFVPFINRSPLDFLRYLFQ